MTFSVIVPTYNREGIVRFAVESVIRQTFSDWEMIIVDDASTDSTPEICEIYAQLDDRIRLFRHTVNRGVSAARNTGLNNAQGDYILFLDSDDALLPDAMINLVTHGVKDNPDIVVYGMDNWLPSEQYGYQFLDRTFIRKSILPEHINITPQTELFLQPFVWNKCFRRSLICDNKIVFDESLRTWEDNIFLVQCLDKAENIVFLPQKLYQANAGAYQVDHLSSHYAPEMVWNYIASYEYYHAQFSNEYDYNNPYTPRRYFQVTDFLLSKINQTVRPEIFRQLLSALVKNESVSHWMEQIEPCSKRERRIKKSFRRGDDRALFFEYEYYARIARTASMIKRVIRKPFQMT